MIKCAGCCVLLLAAIIVCMGQSSPTRVIEAQEFVLHSQDGTIQARLFSGGKGGTLLFYDSAGKGRLAVGVNSADDPGISLLDSNGKERAEISFGGDEPSISLYDSKETVRLALQVSKIGPLVRLYDADQNVRMGLSSSADGSGSTLLMADPTGKMRVSLIEHKGGGLLMYDDHGKETFPKR